MAGILKKNLNWGLSGIKCQKLRFLDIFSETIHQKFLIFCMMVGDNRLEHLKMVANLGKIIIRGLKGIKC